VIPDQYAALARQLITDSEFMRQAAPATVDAVLAAASVRRFPAGTLLYARGAEVCDFVMILEGVLEAGSGSGDGRKSICWHLPAGEWIHMIPLLDGKGSIHDFRAHTDIATLNLPRVAFLQAMQTDFGFNLAVLKILCERSRFTYDTMAAEALLPLPARVARMLLNLVEYHGRRTEAGTEIELKLTQGELAAMLAVSRNSLSRELNAMQESGLIHIAYSHITIRDETGLRGVLESLAD